MKNLCKTLLVASVAVASGFMFTGAKANADTIISSPGVVLDTTPAVTTVDTMYTQPMVISQPAVVAPTITTPVVDTVGAPVIMNDYDNDHLFHLGLGNLLNFSLF